VLVRERERGCRRPVDGDALWTAAAHAALITAAVQMRG
jgi:hypothetical protein